MLDSEQIEALQPSIRTVQIFAAALTVGVALFSIIAAVMIDWSTVHLTISLLSVISLVFGFAMVPISLIVAQVVGHFALRHALEHMEEVGRAPNGIMGMRTLIGVFLTKTIVKFVILGSAVFFCLTVFVLDSSLISLMIAIGLFLSQIALFPRQAQVLKWVDVTVSRC